MTRRFGYILVAVALILVLAGCKTQHEVSKPTDPTLPSIPLNQTPVQQLATAISKAECEECYDIRYGTKTLVGAQKTEDAHSQSVSANLPIDWDEMFAKVPELEVRQDFLERFGNCPLRIIPSNTGIIRYEVSALSWEDAKELLFGDSREEAYADARWSVSLTVDAAGRLSDFEITSEREEEARTVFLSIAFPEDP